MKHKIKLGKKAKQGIAFSIIINLVIAVIAFSFMLNMVSGYWEKDPTTGINIWRNAPPSTPTPTGSSWWGSISDAYNKLMGKADVRKIGFSSGGEAAPGSSTAAKWLGLNKGLSGIVSGAQWALTAYFAGQMLGSLLGLDEEETDALSYAMAAGFGIGKAAYVWGGGAEGIGTGFFAADGSAGFFGLGPTGIGLIAGLVVLELMWESEEKKIITFECYPWEAPTGGSNCEDCNSGLYPCSEYRCKSLGQACQLINKGTGEEKCVWVNPKDVKSPEIKAWKEPLEDEYKYEPNNAVRPPDNGVKILRKSSKCVKAFEALSFGIELNEPAQCKIDYNRTDSYEDMAYYFGNSNIHKYNHSQTLRLPSPEHIEGDSELEIKNDGTYNLYVRCKDANGNTNDDLFVFSFCVEKGPDVTPPKIESTSIKNNMPIQYEKNQTKLAVYVNEPADCSWSRVNQDYDSMENSMSCSQHIWEMNNQMLYKCEDTLTGIQDKKENDYYFRCKDQPWLTGDKANDRNTNVESYKFTIIGTQPLTIEDVKPNKTISGYTSPVPVYLEVETDNGYNHGDSWCSYTNVENPSEDDYIEMKETGTNFHKQRLNLAGGEYTYYFQCVDLGGNAVYDSTTFKVDVDEDAPVVVRVYKSEGKLKVITDEKSTCTFSLNKDRECNFEIDEGNNMPYTNSTEHFAEWKDNQRYYIKCKDESGRQPLPNECSIIVKPGDV